MLKKGFARLKHMNPDLDGRVIFVTGATIPGTIANLRVIKKRASARFFLSSHKLFELLNTDFFFKKSMNSFKQTIPIRAHDITKLADKAFSQFQIKYKHNPIMNRCAMSDIIGRKKNMSANKIVAIITIYSSIKLITTSIPPPFIFKEFKDKVNLHKKKYKSIVFL